MALPEKALLDQLYLFSKGIKNFTFDNYDFSFLKLTRLKTFLAKFPNTRQFKASVNKLKDYFKL